MTRPIDRDGSSFEIACQFFRLIETPLPCPISLNSKARSISPVSSQAVGTRTDVHILTSALVLSSYIPAEPSS